MSIDLKKLDKAFSDIQKEVGKDVIINKDTFSKSERVHCSSPLLTHIMAGGWPVGKIIELYGKESSGKSLLAQQAVADYQKVGTYCCYIDLEYSFDFDFAEKIGIDTSPDKFKLFQPTTGEEAFEIAEKLSCAGVGLIVFDSVVGMKPDSEYQSNYGDQQMGVHAKMMGKGLRKLSSIFNKNETTAILINQIRQGIGQFVSPVQTPGGNALKFYASLRLEVRQKEFLSKPNSDPYGIVTHIKGKKSKIGPPDRKGMVSILFNSGFDTDSEYINFAINLGLIEKAGSWFTINSDGKRVQGIEKVKDYFKSPENQKEFEKLQKQITSLMTTGELVEEEDDDKKSDKKKRKKKDDKEDPSIEIEVNEKEQ